jgi:hypothetical protein
MFKNIGILLVLGLLLISITFGSYGRAEARSIYAPDEMPDDVMLEAFPLHEHDNPIFNRHIHEMADKNYTTMIIDLSGNGSIDYFENVSSHKPFLPLPDDDQGPDSLVAGRMVVLVPGGKDPEAFPIKWNIITGREMIAHDPESIGYFSSFKMNISKDGKPSELMFLGPDTGYSPPIDGKCHAIYGKLSFKRHTLPSLGHAASEEFTNSIMQGETNWHKSEVNAQTDSLKVDMGWADTDSKLRLVIYTPDGQILGPYFDDSDGNTDGRINLNVTNEEGVAQGQWNYKVNCVEAAGKVEYYLRTGF